MNKWTKKSAIVGAKQWIKVIYASPIFKVLLHQLVNKQTNKWMNKRTKERVFVRQNLQVEDKCSESAVANLHRSFFLPTAAKNDVRLH